MIKLTRTAVFVSCKVNRGWSWRTSGEALECRLRMFVCLLFA